MKPAFVLSGGGREERFHDAWEALGRFMELAADATDGRLVLARVASGRAQEIARHEGVIKAPQLGIADRGTGQYGARKGTPAPVKGVDSATAGGSYSMSSSHVSGYSDRGQREVKVLRKPRRRAPVGA